ncbi:MAG: acylphosphatase [bacterium]|nr:acylphosphatase [bacterium]
MKEALQAVVVGSVQGVGFRWFVVRHARSLGLLGTVANLPDGTVRVVAVGERGDLESLVALLREGPSASRVSDVKLQWAPATETYRDFSVL